MSRNINAAGMNYAQKADIDMRCKNRILKVSVQCTCFVILINA
jgi:hypothetical protein